MRTERARTAARRRAGATRARIQSRRRVVARCCCYWWCCCWWCWCCCCFRCGCCCCVFSRRLSSDRHPLFLLGDRCKTIHARCYGRLHCAPRRAARSSKATDGGGDDDDEGEEEEEEEEEEEPLTRACQIEVKWQAQLLALALYQARVAYCFFFAPGRCSTARSQRAADVKKKCARVCCVRRSTRRSATRARRPRRRATGRRPRLRRARAAARCAWGGGKVKLLPSHRNAPTPPCAARTHTSAVCLDVRRCAVWRTHPATPFRADTSWGLAGALRHCCAPTRSCTQHVCCSLSRGVRLIVRGVGGHTAAACVTRHPSSRGGAPHSNVLSVCLSRGAADRARGLAGGDDRV